MEQRRYKVWLYMLKKSLIHPDAILCVKSDDDLEIRRLWASEYSIERAALLLNQRYNNGYLDKKKGGLNGKKSSSSKE